MSIEDSLNRIRWPRDIVVDASGNYCYEGNTYDSLDDCNSALTGFYEDYIEAIHDLLTVCAEWMVDAHKRDCSGGVECDCGRSELLDEIDEVLEDAISSFRESFCVED